MMESHKKLTRDQSRDTGMAMVLLCLILYLFLGHRLFLVGAIALHVLNMTVPQLYRPIAVVWLGLSHLLGTIVSKMLLTVVFFVVVTPMAILRRLAGKDALKLRVFKAGQDSVMLERNHKFSARDMERPF